MPAPICPCGAGPSFDECCGPLLAGRVRATSAEQLMRSRYTAFAVGDVAHLLATWHPSTRPRTLTLEAGTSWYRLDVVSTSGGSSLDTRGTVEFRAFFRSADGRGVQQETSRFVREGGAWFYADGDVR
ncbi:MAG: YchJ family protein [Actinobacteria bacterium]|nr:YchJ family protein [Actinomycetota bacterium]